jgi:hypothetical protein
MQRYGINLIQEAIKLRSKGQTYEEIRQVLNLKIPKGTLHSWFKDIILPKSYYSKISKLNVEHLKEARVVAVKANKIKRQAFLEGLDISNLPIADLIINYEPAKIALAMLCLGEASKYKSSSSFSLGSSDPRIIVIFLALLRICFNFNPEKVRCTVQCRADQNIEELERFWKNVTGVPKRLFYKARIDPRTIGKPTKKVDYQGVLRVDYLDTKVQLELESLSELIYNRVHNYNKGP